MTKEGFAYVERTLRSFMILILAMSFFIALRVSPWNRWYHWAWAEPLGFYISYLAGRMSIRARRKFDAHVLKKYGR